MNFEQPPMPSPEEVAKIEKERALADAELLKEGADYRFNEEGEKILDVTDEQIEEARREMEKDENASTENQESKPKITPKSPELLQAQAAAFAAEQVEHYKDSGHIFDNLDSLIADDLRDVNRVTQEREYHNDGEEGKMVRIPENTERKVAKTEDYIDFLRSVDGSKYEAIHRRADMITQYNQKFEPVVNRLLDDLQGLSTREEHPAFLGSGLNSDVFHITHEGKDYAVRIPSGKKTNPAVIDSHLAGAVIGKGIPRLEQIIAASYKDGVTVAEIMPGKEMGNDMTIEDVSAIKDEQLSELVDTLITVSESGIEIDPKSNNIFYDREAGFGVVDYHSSKVAGKASADQNLGKIVGWMSAVIMNSGSFGYSAKKTADYYVKMANRLSVNLEILRRYRIAVESKLTGNDRETALKLIDSDIESYQKTINDYLNPEYVAEKLDRDAKQQKSVANPNDIM